MAITIDPQIMSGALVFTGTRVPVSALLESIDAGATIEDFLENFPTVTREQIDSVLAESEFHEDMAVANKVMKEDREVLSRLARS